MAKTLPLDDIGALMKALDSQDVPPEGDALAPSGVLRVQLGYNPNSSSLGTSVVMLLWGMGTAVILLQAVGAVLLAKRAKALNAPQSTPDKGAGQ